MSWMTRELGSFPSRDKVP